MNKTTVAIEQIKDCYGNLLQLWGVYSITSTVNSDTPMVKKHEMRHVLSVHASLHEAQKHVQKHK